MPSPRKNSDHFLGINFVTSARREAAGVSVYLPLNTPIFRSEQHSALIASNQHERHELFLLAEGEKKVTFATETRVPNASLFTFRKEDHTLANLLRARLLKSPNVQFAAYKIPHPLFATFELRVQTDGSISPKDAVVQACADIVTDLQRLDQEFTKEWELKKIAVSGQDM
ncbi:DNA-directed RNA polymerase II subunit RPB11 [Sphaceloma murrayae]|uniref:DNA-directed RNA polymerase II subunit RPB11 n=1 Tax=Sphaceloma murrayae TaxID=2082308 RepID=A0A2K1QSH0_9PEZI|nr:DNA-directed RNA polymerase II subunit RPB11 [Sphaceloma murrayae]